MRLFIALFYLRYEVWRFEKQVAYLKIRSYLTLLHSSKMLFTSTIKKNRSE